MTRPYNFIKSIVKDNYELFKDLMPYQEALERAINTVLEPIDFVNIFHSTLTFNSKDELKNKLHEELQYEVNINQGVEAGDYHTLTGDKIDHKPWYREKVAAEEIDFRFWKRYKKYLLNIKNWPEATVNRLDEVTDDIIERIEDPLVRNRAFDRRGLVVGYVQSGKTANYTGVINKAIDSGYKVIIVLSGMHKNLRSQTQMRIDEEVIGRDTSDQAQVRRIGVTTLPNESYINVDTFTTQDDNGDFSRAFAQQVGGVQPSSDRPLLLVLKKNVSPLGNLLRYFRECLDTLGNEYVLRVGENAILNNLPLLLIDDEADQASVDANPQFNVDVELDPTAINRNIRQLLNLFNQKAYIGYTATPFANIFIQHETDHSIYGRDLFPSSFIISMEAPSNYFGPVQVFGLNDNEEERGYPIHISVNDASQEHSVFLPLRHRMTDVPNHIPDSMKEAIKSFIISCAIRRLRGQGSKPNTMLIHCTRYKDIQNAIGVFVEEEFNRLRSGIINSDLDVLEEIRILFERDFVRISKAMEGAIHSWEEVREILKQSVLRMERRPHVINGSSGDILDYKNNEDIGYSVIAIGGDKLSRGLTLEGLTVSYFTRASSLYDTLMQMGRWFGYRAGYEDLCRIYSTDFLFSWYRDISTAFEVLRKDFLEMIRQKATPMEFGLRVLAHPDMMATNAMKMRHTTTLPLSYKGKLTETSSLSGEKSILINNYNAVESFIQSLSQFPLDPKENSSYLWTEVPKEEVISFFRQYISFRGAPASNTERIVEFINKQEEGQNPNTILNTWNVALASLIRNPTEENVQVGGLPVKPFTRSIKDVFINNRLFVKRIVSNVDEKIDFEIETTASSEELRKLEPRLNRPLITIYPLQIENYRATEDLPAELLPLEKMPFGFAISWPNNDTLKQSTYDINSVYEELELTSYD